MFYVSLTICWLMFVYPRMLVYIFSICVLSLQQIAMFHNSSQRKYWTFKSEDDLEQMRVSANEKFRKTVLETGKVGKRNVAYFDSESLTDPCLSVCFCTSLA